jgi:hypothetical protein
MSLLTDKGSGGEVDTVLVLPKASKHARAAVVGINLGKRRFQSYGGVRTYV